MDACGRFGDVVAWWHGGIPDVEIHGFIGSRHGDTLIWRLQGEMSIASLQAWKFVDFDVSSMERHQINGFGLSGENAGFLFFEIY